MIFKEEYVVHEKLCETSFSVIYKTVHQSTRRVMTIKMERHPNSSEYLLNETKIRKLLSDVNGIPAIQDYGIYKSRRYIIYPFVENTLYKKRLSKTILFLCASSLIETLQSIHAHGILHCDISATNVLFQDNASFFISDFGQSKHYNYVLDKNVKSCLHGCPLFCSENVHQGIEFSFRDDMISLGYLLFYCTRGTLPWCGLNSHKEIYEQKQKFRARYWNLEIPKELKIYLNYCFHLGINDRPEYSLLKRLFQTKLKSTDKQIEIET